MKLEFCGIIQIINGPNLNLLGTREPSIYGNDSMDDYLNSIRKSFPDLEIRYAQSNHEGDLVDLIQACGLKNIPIILNAGAYTHTSVALADAISASKAYVVEVHISNIFAREEFRHNSFISPKAVAVISGLGLFGYEAAIQYILDKSIRG